MGDYFVSIAVPGLPEDEAEGAGAGVLAWLVERGVVEAQVTDCALAATAHAPGPHATSVLADPGEGEPRYAVNGVQVVTGRTAFDAFSGEQAATCPHCATVITENDNAYWLTLSPAMDDWCKGGHGVAECPTCRTDVELNRWQWEAPIAFAPLGLTFWNWPELAPAFLDELSGRVGYPLVVVPGKV